MKYPDSSLARLGDRVRFSNGDFGIIVLSIDTNEYSADYPEDKWCDLGSGVMILTDNGALVRYCDPVPDNLIVRVIEDEK